MVSLIFFCLVNSSCCKLLLKHLLLWAAFPNWVRLLVTPFSVLSQHSARVLLQHLLQGIPTYWSSPLNCVPLKGTSIPTYPTTSSSQWVPRACVRVQKKKKSLISEVVKEGLTEKMGFEQYLIGKHWISKNYKNRREHGRPRQKRTNTNYAQETGIGSIWWA